MMAHCSASQAITDKDGLAEWPWGSSLPGEVDIGKVGELAADRLLRELPPQVALWPVFGQVLWTALKIDGSSVRPRFEPRSETVLEREEMQSSIPHGLSEPEIEYDMVVRMSAKQRCTMRAHIISVRRAEPKIVAPASW